MYNRPLQAVFQKCLEDAYSQSSLDRIARIYIKQGQIDKPLVDQLLSSDLTSARTSPFCLIEKWREMLALLLLMTSAEELSLFRERLAERIARLRAITVWKEFQLLNAYQAVTGLLMDDPVNEPAVNQLESGACLMEGGGHWAWGDIPQPLFQAELGILWCLYGLISGSTRYLKAAERLADWQKHTLDRDFVPFAGLFSQEETFDKTTLLTHNYILFHAVGNLAGRADLSYIADRQLELLSSALADGGYISCFYVILQNWFAALPQVPSAQAAPLAAAFEDSDLALAGCRTTQASAVASMFGGGSSMGCFHYNDIQVVGFGPQHLPLGECRGFGLEGGARLLSTHVKAIRSREGEFLVEGVARMAARPKESKTLSSFRHGDPSGAWIDAKLHFQNNSLDIQTQFHSIYDTPIAFVFFVNAQSCLINDRPVKRRSFAHYQGKAESVQLKGGESSLYIHPQSSQGEMHVIPLGGGANFWGADFLVAFMLEAKTARWQIQAVL